MRLLTIALIIGPTVNVCLSGCARTTGTEAAEQYLAEKKLTVADCGSTNVGRCESTIADTVLTCLRDAATACRPARATVSQPSVEGDPIVTTVIVNAECKFVVFHDTLADQFGPQQVTRETCSKLTVMTVGCPPVAATECVDKKKY